MNEETEVRLITDHVAHHLDTALQVELRDYPTAAYSVRKTSTGDGWLITVTYLGAERDFALPVKGALHVIERSWDVIRAVKAWVSNEAFINAAEDTEPYHPEWCDNFKEWVTTPVGQEWVRGRKAAGLPVFEQLW